MKDYSKCDAIKVLFVDDDQAFLKSVKNCMKNQGAFKIEQAFSVEEAQEKLAKTEIDVIVCDIKMPVTNGFEFLKILRRNNNEIPFIVFTVTDDKEQRLKRTA